MLHPLTGKLLRICEITWVCESPFSTANMSKYKRTCFRTHVFPSSRLQSALGVKERIKLLYIFSLEVRISDEILHSN